MEHLSLERLHAGLAEIRNAPKDDGELVLIVRRPSVGEREVLREGALNLVEGLAGDNWRHKPSSRTNYQGPHPQLQLTLMNARAIALIAQTRDRWQLAGDQLFVDLDLSGDNLASGTRLSIGGAMVQVSAEPHTGCKKFIERFGVDAMKFVNSPVGRELNLRGINATVVQPGSVRVGDRITRVSPV